MQHLGLPLIVDGPGSYLTRGGEVVTIQHIASDRGFGYNNRAVGRYADGTAEFWSCRGGRVLPFSLSRNDIVSKA